MYKLRTGGGGIRLEIVSSSVVLRVESDRRATSPHPPFPRKWFR